MIKYLVKYSVVIIFVVITLSGCVSVQNEFKEKTLNDMYPILSDEQYQTMKSLNSNEELTNYVDEYWQSIDSTSNVNEYKAEYLQRLEYANEHFPDRKGWGRSDRKRIYLIYGPPSYIERYDYTEIRLGRYSTIKAMEVWLYMTPGKNNSFPARVDNSYKGERKFIFADVNGVGIYKILYSSEDNRDIDPWMFRLLW
ncbi:MAG: GWxTD domain-containing protein [Ignavibacteria bacterium]|nr:GWxTD domain-containing protein [Ignavibacteria bacterium]